jgi:hypothetical protein
VLGRQLQDQAAAIPQGEQIRQEQDHPQVRALAVHIRGHPIRGVGQFLPGHPRQHPRVGAEGIAIEAGGATGCLQSLEITGLGFFYAAGDIQRPAAGAVREFEQGPAVVDQLQAVPQAGEGGVFQPREVGGCGVVGEVGLLGFVVLRRRVMGTGCWWGQSHCQKLFLAAWEGYAGSAWFQSDHPGKLVGKTEEDGFICGSAYEGGLMSHLP